MKRHIHVHTYETHINVQKCEQTHIYVHIPAYMNRHIYVQAVALKRKIETSLSV
jgi:hypothetical protein